MKIKNLLIIVILMVSIFSPSHSYGDQLYIDPDGIYQILLPSKWSVCEEEDQVHFELKKGVKQLASCYVSIFEVEKGMTVDEIVSLSEDQYEMSGFGLNSTIIAKERTVISGVDAILLKQKIEYDAGFINVITRNDYYYLIKQNQGVLLYFITAEDYNRHCDDFNKMAKSFNIGEEEKDIVTTQGGGPGETQGQNSVEAEWVEEGNKLYSKGMYAEAIIYYNKALEVEPGNVKAWYGKGNALHETGRVKKSLDCFDRVIQLIPEDFIAWNNKGYLLYELGDYKEAIKCAEKAIEINPECSCAWDTRGDILMASGRYEEAKKSYQKALQFETRHSYRVRIEMKI